LRKNSFYIEEYLLTSTARASPYNSEVYTQPVWDENEDLGLTVTSNAVSRVAKPPHFQRERSL